jgi:hypothetical protein
MCRIRHRTTEVKQNCWENQFLPKSPLSRTSISAGPASGRAAAGGMKLLKIL